MEVIDYHYKPEETHPLGVRNVVMTSCRNRYNMHIKFFPSNVVFLIKKELMRIGTLADDIMERELEDTTLHPSSHRTQRELDRLITELLINKSEYHFMYNIV